MLYAWSEDTQGSEYFTLYVKDLTTGELLGQPIEECDGGFLFSPDNQWLFWVWRDENSRPSKVFRRPARGGEDVLVYEEKDGGYFLNIGMMSSDAFIEVTLGNHETSEAWLIPAGDPTAAPVCVEPRREGVQYSVDHWDDRFIIVTNADEAIDFKIMTSDAAVPSRDTWRESVPHRPGIYISGAGAYKRHMVRVERENANTRIVITNKATGDEHSISVPEEAYALGMASGLEYDTDILRYTYTSPTTPSQTFDYHMTTREQVLRKTQVIPSATIQRTTLPSALCQVVGRRRRAADHIDASRHPARRFGSRSALRLRLVRHADGSGLLDPQPQPCQSRLGLRHRPCARRR